MYYFRNSYIVRQYMVPDIIRNLKDPLFVSNICDHTN